VCLTYIKSYIPCKEISIINDIEVTAIQINEIEKFTICNIYLPNQKQFKKSDLENIINQLPKPYIIVSNFNTNSPTWGSKKADFRGKEIDKLLENDNIVILNDSTPAYINLKNGNLSCIDLALCSIAIAQKLEWNVLSKMYSSDYIPIKINFFPRKRDINHIRKKDGT